MKIAEFEKTLFDMFPKEQAEPWDHIGLSVGDPQAQITGIACALDASLDNLDQAKHAGANVLLTHHPVYLEAPSTFSPQSSLTPSCSAVVYEAIKNNIAIISMHTNLDRSQEVRDKLPSLFGLQAYSSLENAQDPQLPGLGSLCRCEEVSLAKLSQQAAAVFDTNPRVWGKPDQSIKHVAILGGALGHFGEQALQVAADAAITGECSYHTAQDLSQRGISVILLGHDKSEQPFCNILAKAANKVGIPDSNICKLECPQQWWTA